jgi:hypothetical protein
MVSFLMDRPNLTRRKRKNCWNEEEGYEEEGGGKERKEVDKRTH